MTEKWVVIDVRFQQSSTGTASTWVVFSAFGNAGFLDEVAIAPGGNAVMFNGMTQVGAVPITRGVWHDFQLVIDFASGTVSGSVDSVPIGTQALGSASTAVTDVEFGFLELPAGTDTAFWDNLSVINQSPVISKTFSPFTVLVGGTAALSFNITNSSVTGSETNVGFTDPLPSGLTVANPNGFMGSPTAGWLRPIPGIPASACRAVL